ncbi:MAG: hypothetical protein DRP42_04030 [Tenericutes bacterium]|nr:MAG: hypothetical protein DRP42_04030 [Mycoplasmatota bacterium]
MEFWESGDYGDIDFPEDLFDNYEDPQDGFLDAAQKQMEDNGFGGLSVQELGLGLGFAEEMTVDNEHELEAAFDAACQDDFDPDDAMLIPLHSRDNPRRPGMAFHQWVKDVANGKKTLDDPLL